MNTPLIVKKSAHHPMIIIAAIAVFLFCMTGIAAILGWIPSSVGGNNSAGRGDLSEADRQALAAGMAPPPALNNFAAAPRQVQNDAPPSPQAPTNYVPETRAVRPEKAQRTVEVASAAPAKNWCADCGNVESVREINTRANGSGVGAAGGAILGGLLGNQIGGGHGRQLATVAGAVGGAVVGNQVEGNMKATRSYEIRVLLDDGSARTFHQQNAPGWRQGDRVRVVKGALRSVG